MVIWRDKIYQSDVDLARDIGVSASALSHWKKIDSIFGDEKPEFFRQEKPKDEPRPSKPIDLDKIPEEYRDKVSTIIESAKD